MLTLFALHTRHLLDHVGHVDLVVCAGAAGALADGIAVGDIVIATRTIEHDYQQGFSQTPYLEIRGVTDQARVDAPSHFEQNLGLAMRNIATLLGSWLRPR